MITIQDMVSREVHYCVSSLVSTLAGAVYTGDNFPASGTDLQSLAEQAYELAAPIDDWEEAALEAGWTIEGDHFFHVDFPDETWDNAQRLCDAHDLPPCEHEIFEHWIVSDWLADKLEAHGEKVDRDFAGMTVWARTCSGQAIYADSVIERIHAELAR